MALLRLYALELNGAAIWIIHLAGISLLIGRVIHAHGMLRKIIKLRILGIQITIYVLIGLSLLNLVFLPYKKLLARW